MRSRPLRLARIAATTVVLALGDPIPGLAQSPADGSQASPGSAPPGRPPRAIVYGGNRNFPPYEYLDPTGKPTGFNVALIEALGREAGVTITVELGAWRERLAALERGDIDLVTMAVTDERARRFGMLVQTWTLQHSVVFKSGRRNYPRGMDDLGAESIATEPRALMDDLLRQLPEVRRPVLVPADNQIDALRRVLANQASGAAGNSLALRYTANALGVRDLVEVPIKSMAYYISTQKGREAEFGWIEPALVKLRGSGQFERLVERHLALPVGRPASALGRYLLAFTGVVGVLWLGTFVWTRSLQRQVRAQTIELRRTLDDRASQARLLQGLLEGTARVTGEAFFPSLVGNLSEALGVRDAVVAEVVGKGRSRLRTIAVWSRGRLTANTEYDLAGTVAEHVLANGLYYCPAGVDECFRLSSDPKQSGLSSFLGAPLVDADGTSIGLLAVLDLRPLDPPARAETAVRIFAGRAAAELERQRSASALASTSQVLRAISRIQSGFISKTEGRDAFDEMLEELLAFTDSPYGFIGETLHDDQGRPYLKTHAISNLAWDTATRDFYAARAANGLEFRNMATLFGAAITTGAPVISNDPVRDPRSGGLPPGHPPLNAFLGLPVYRGEELVGLVGAANRPGGYDQALAESLRPFLATCGLLIEAYRADTRRHIAEEDRRQLEAQVQHAQKLESLGVLAGGIAHDFNNLLVGVLGHAELARMDVPHDSPLAERLGHIEIAALRASELTNQMLAYSGKGRFLVEPIDLTRLVREMAQLLDVSISKKAQLRYEFDAGTPTIDGDQAQVRQVVMNLMTNASEAIGDQEGVITIRTGTRHADAAYLAGSAGGAVPPPGDYVFLELVDTGCGMDAETAGRIFDPFFTTKFTGRGLGLAATLGIVRSHGGGIRIQTAPGRGSTFTVLLPCGKLGAVSEAPAPPKEEPVEPLGSGIVLVVDDEPDVRRVAQAALSRAGLPVLTAADGRQALAVIEARGEAIAVVILDMTMPVMGGDEVLARLQVTRPDIVVILSSGYTEPDVARTLGVRYDCTFIQKPYRSATLVEQVRAALDRHGNGQSSPPTVG